MQGLSGIGLERLTGLEKLQTGRDIGEHVNYLGKYLMLMRVIVE